MTFWYEFYLWRELNHRLQRNFPVGRLTKDGLGEQSDDDESKHFPPREPCRRSTSSRPANDIFPVSRPAVSLPWLLTSVEWHQKLRAGCGRFSSLLSQKVYILHALSKPRETDWPQPPDGMDLLDKAEPRRGHNMRKTQRSPLGTSCHRHQVLQCNNQQQIGSLRKSIHTIVILLENTGNTDARCNTIIVDVICSTG
ncbi:hypothetical protein L249_0515 [Ophiocordyceps polyrhachis-furcata BCC 54312]|uniref:Uncharacterized protein n=1 Tax=Ophiocordyceps polyrhachis-furcata BCC 54312 TaxID=1330021 RepID=A0A367LC53_9HYPO|nr:hypothetical protein L249_0515 [Ophiocordyceps polyrhachis-furcata BCC 54312]